MALQQSVQKSESGVEAIRQALEVAANLVYLARTTNRRDQSDGYLEKAEGQIKAIGELAGKLS